LRNTAITIPQQHGQAATRVHNRKIETAITVEIASHKRGESGARDVRERIECAISVPQQHSNSRAVR